VFLRSQMCRHISSIRTRACHENVLSFPTCVGLGRWERVSLGVRWAVTLARHVRRYGDFVLVLLMLVVIGFWIRDENEDDCPGFQGQRPLTILVS
jgi:hypothetical protein